MLIYEVFQNEGDFVQYCSRKNSSRFFQHFAGFVRSASYCSLTYTVEISGNFLQRLRSLLFSRFLWLLRTLQPASLYRHLPIKLKILIFLALRRLKWVSCVAAQSCLPSRRNGFQTSHFPGVLWIKKFTINRVVFSKVLTYIFTKYSIRRRKNCLGQNKLMQFY